MTAQRSRTGVGIIGCGNISNVYAAKLSALPFIDLVACADVLPDPAKELAERHGIPKVLEPDRLIADDDVEVVVNLTIPAAHYPVSRRVVDSGKSVFCEKPLALTLDEGLDLGRAAKDHDRLDRIVVTAHVGDLARQVVDLVEGLAPSKFVLGWSLVSHGRYYNVVSVVPNKTG